MSIYSLNEKDLHDLAERSVVLRSVVNDVGSLKDTWLKVRREFYNDILVPEGGNGNWDKETYAYIKVPANEIWFLPVPLLHRALLANGSWLPNQVIDGERCYFVTARHLIDWGIPNSVRTVPDIGAAILHGPWVSR